MGRLQEVYAVQPVTMVTRVGRNGKDAVLTLACGHEQLVEDFPEGDIPSCFRRECHAEGCGGTVQ